MNFVFEQIRVGGDRNFGYLLGDRKAQEAALVDPAYTPEACVERAEAQGLKVTYIINTHGHDDHVNGNEKAQRLTGAAIAAFKDTQVKHDVALQDASTLSIGSLTLHFLHTPGHADDHIVIWIPAQKVALTGDLIFVGKVGGTGTPEASHTEWNSLLRVLQELPDDATIWPGHDYGCRPASTLGLEKANNPFLASKNFVAFQNLKNDWPIFKHQHGLK